MNSTQNAMHFLLFVPRPLEIWRADNFAGKGGGGGGVRVMDPKC